MTGQDARDVIAEAINDDGWTCDVHEPHRFGECTPCRDAQTHTAQAALDALAAADWTLIRGSEYQRDLAAIADWQKSALRVIEAANQLMLDLVCGEGDPRDLARALVEGGFDGRLPEEASDDRH